MVLKGKASNGLRLWCVILLLVLCQARMKSERLSLRPTIKISCSGSRKIKAYTSPSRSAQTWRRAVTSMCSLWLLTTRRVWRNVAWCLGPALCRTMEFWEGTVVLKTCSMLNSHLEQVSPVSMCVYWRRNYIHFIGSIYHIVLHPLERKVPLRLNYSKYGDLLTGDNLIRLAALLLDYSTREQVLALRNIVLDNPEIKIRVSISIHSSDTTICRNFYCWEHRAKLSWDLLGDLHHLRPSVGCSLQILGEPKEHRKLAAEITLKNPLSQPLEGCCFNIEGANLTGGQVISERYYESP